MCLEKENTINGRNAQICSIFREQRKQLKDKVKVGERMLDMPAGDKMQLSSDEVKEPKGLVV